MDILLLDLVRRGAEMKMQGKGLAAELARVFLGLLMPAVVAAMQLPPDMQADRYLVRAQRQIEGQDFAGAKQSMEQILELQSQHGLEIPEEFFYRYAEVLDRLELHDDALEAATKYLTLAGRDGEHYREALELLNQAEQAKAAAEAAAEAERKKAAAAKAAAEEARRRSEEIASRSRVFDGIQFVWVPAGEFRMGSTSREADDDEQPLTRVRISRGFYLGKYEVTQGQWQAVMGRNPSYFDECGPTCPVETVSWDDVQEFIGKLNAAVGEERYRLPTEAEWEYAARAGTRRDRYGNLDAIAWYEDNSGSRTHPVGEKDPNTWGLHDMLGNVWEWTQDRYGDYPGGSVTDPQGPASGSERVARGGGWYGFARYCRASNRGYDSPGSRDGDAGFRLLRTK